MIMITLVNYKLTILIKDFQREKIEKITVPSVWERFKKDYEGVVYYRTSFKVDKDYKDKKIHLNFNASNYITSFS